MSPRRTRAETAFLAAEHERVAGAVADRCAAKEELLHAMRDAAFWHAPDRFETLAHAEYLDRLDAAGRTAERLAHRLVAGTRNHGSPAVDLIRLLASRLYVLTRALEERGSGELLDAVITVSPITGAGQDGAASDEFVRRLVGMYVNWAERRGMRVEQDDDAPRLGVSGLAAYSILRPEGGLHVLEGSPLTRRSESQLA